MGAYRCESEGCDERRYRDNLCIGHYKYREVAPEEEQPIIIEGEPVALGTSERVVPLVLNGNADAALVTGKDKVTPRKVTAKSAALAARRRQALEMAIAGASYQQIADTLGWKNREAVRRTLRGMMMEAIEIPQEDIELLRAREQLVHERLRSANYTNAVRGDSRAAEIVLKCSKAIAALRGLDAPEKIEVQVGSQLDAEIDALLALLPSAGERKQIEL